RIIGRKIFFRVEFDREEISNRVGVFVAVQTSRGDPAGIRFDSRIGPIEFRMDRVGERLQRGIGRPGDSRWWHLSRLDAPQTFFPLLARSSAGVGAGQPGAADPAGKEPIVVTLGAGSRQYR